MGFFGFVDVILYSFIYVILLYGLFMLNMVGVFGFKECVGGFFMGLFNII